VTINRTRANSTKIQPFISGFQTRLSKCFTNLMLKESTRMLQPSERGSIWRNKNFKLRPGPTQKSKARLAEVIGPNLDLVQGDSHKDRISMTRSGRRRHIRRSCLRQRCAHAAAGSTLCTGCNKLKTTSAEREDRLRQTARVIALRSLPSSGKLGAEISLE
jgi:hypothetical protein